MWNKISVLFLLFLLSHVAFAQGANEKMLFVIDSVALITDPEDWNPVSGDDIADVQVIRSKDSLRMLGWSQLDGITYLFTKAYRSRTDSINQIPGLRRMTEGQEGWYFHNVLYSGSYIDYYNNGDIQSQGTLINGKINGQVTIYFKGGIVKSVSSYRNGVLEGVVKKYYKNGVLMEESRSAGGKNMIEMKSYFMNGQVEQERKEKKDTPYDTLVTYYSTGKLRSLFVEKRKMPVRSDHDEAIGYYTAIFQQAENRQDVKEMGKSFFHLWLLDSNNIDTRFKEGLLLASEERFDEAITSFDRVLQIEPLYREALLQRGLTRLRKQQHRRLHTTLNKPATESPASDDFTSLPPDEQRLVCADFILADQLDYSDYVVKKRIPATVFRYCTGKE